MDERILEDSIKFYNITDENYIKKCSECIKYINKNPIIKTKFNELYQLLYSDNILKIRNLWNIKDIDKLFDAPVNPFLTSLLLLNGFKKHIHNMNKLNFDKNQQEIHKKRVKEVLETDVLVKGGNGIRVSQMLWGTYFINCRLIEVENLQYEYYNDGVIKIHIPKKCNFNGQLIKQSLTKSKVVIGKYFNIFHYEYFCDSWLLSNQVHNMLDKTSNIYNFYNLFEVQDGKDCIADILNFVFGLKEINDYNNLEEETSLQKTIKNYLIEGNSIKMGIGKLKID